MISGGDEDFVIDIETSTNAAIENGSCLVVCDRSIRGEKDVIFENRLHNCAEIRLENGHEKVEKAVRAEKHKKKGCAKPPKPPRPPRPPSLDLADQKFIREISELAMLKKARADRMKSLKKIKNGKPASSSAGNVFGLVITLVFCVVIFWQGVYSKDSSNSAFLGSPESSIGTTTNSSGSSIISFQFYHNASNAE